MDNTHYISTKKLDLKTLYNIVSDNLKLQLSNEVKDKITNCRTYLNEKLKSQDLPIYGINTGFGSLYNVKITKENLSKLQENLMMSHACGTGEEVPESIVKLMLLLKIQSLSYGHSGVQLRSEERRVGKE